MGKTPRGEFWILAWSAVSALVLLAFIYIAGSVSTEDVPVEERPAKVVYQDDSWTLVKIQ